MKYLQIFQDYSLASVHWDAMNNIVKTELEKDPVYVANNSAQVLLFVQNSCENNCSGNGVCSSEGQFTSLAKTKMFSFRINIIQAHKIDKKD